MFQGRSAYFDSINFNGNDLSDLFWLDQGSLVQADSPPGIQLGQKVWLPRQTGDSHLLATQQGPTLDMSLSLPPCFSCLLHTLGPPLLLGTLGNSGWNNMATVRAHLTSQVKAGSALAWLLEFQDPNSQLSSRDRFRAASSSKALWPELLAPEGG